MPRPTRDVKGPLFQGTIRFAQVTFEAPSHSYVVPDADMATIVDYPKRAIAPSRLYARQYDPTRAKVASRLIRYTATLTGTSYTDRQLKSRVDEMASSRSLPAPRASSSSALAACAHTTSMRTPGTTGRRALRTA